MALGGGDFCKKNVTYEFLDVFIYFGHPRQFYNIIILRKEMSWLKDHF